MKIQKVVLTTLFLAALVPTTYACSYLFDNFFSLPNKATDPSANWYVIQTGNGGQTYDYVTPGSSSTLSGRGLNKSAKLSVTPDDVVADYQNAELSDVNTGWVFGSELPWKPTMHHPVILNAKVKWGSNYNLDGSGGAVGSSGLWMWNVPVDYAGGELHPMDAFGINWATQGSAMGEGLNVMTLQSSWPVSMKSVAAELPTFDMQEWNDLKIIWRQTNSAGAQEVKMYLNNTLVDTVALEYPMGSLAVQMWNDNQLYSWEGPIMQDPVETQDFFVDNVRVLQL
jgi:hypothetical protein